MEKTRREIIREKWRKFGKKNKLCKVLAVALIFELSLWCAFLQFLVGNTKKFTAIGTVLLFFMVSCSFTLPGLVEVMPIEVAEITNNLIEEDALLREILEQEKTISLDDEELLDGYKDEELSNADVDVYTIDELLIENAASSQSIMENTTLTEESNGQVVLDKNDWKLILINKQHPVPEEYEVQLGTLKNNMKCDKRIISDLYVMLQEAKVDGINLVICSPFRDYSRQEYLFERKINAYMAKGLSYMEAYMISSQAVTVPGASEHQIGLALDIVSDTYMSLNEGFGETKAGKWLYENAHKYGFTQRYPEDKEHITGIMYEPWHYRYVGIDAATVMQEKNITLEELVEGL